MPSHDDFVAKLLPHGLVGRARQSRAEDRRYAASWDDLAPLVNMPPRQLTLRVRRHSTVFVAEKAA